MFVIFAVGGDPAVFIRGGPGWPSIPACCITSFLRCRDGWARGILLHLYFRDVEPETGVQLGWLPLTSLVVFIAGFGIGLPLMPWLMSAEIVPARVKGPGTSIASFGSWLIGPLSSPKHLWTCSNF